MGYSPFDIAHPVLAINGWLSRRTRQSLLFVPPVCENVGNVERVRLVSNLYRQAADFHAELRHFLRRREELARAHGLTPRQHLLLLQIAGADGGSTRVSELVTRLALTQSAVTELVQRAEEAGLVRRARSPLDGRAIDLSLTPDGARRLAAVAKGLRTEPQQLLSLLQSLEASGPPAAAEPSAQSSRRASSRSSPAGETR
jgi:DNA-binding MarR family transcriptional regulator